MKEKIVYTCEACGWETDYSSDIFTCPVCSDEICDDCAYECSECVERVCFDCIDLHCTIDEDFEDETLDKD